MPKKMVQETLHNGGPYDGNGWPPEDPEGFMEWFQERIDQIPFEYRNTARIEFSSEGGYYNEHAPHIEITYLRPETDEQYSSRLQREAQEAADPVRARELRGSAALAALIAKFGKPESDA